MHRFGVGLVATPSDFNANGPRPSHRELLDWIACDPVDLSWSLEAVDRAIVLSAARRTPPVHPDPSA